MKIIYYEINNLYVKSDKYCFVIIMLDDEQLVPLSKGTGIKLLKIFIYPQGLKGAVKLMINMP